MWKLEALQTFVFDLHWPDEVFGEHISSRLKTLSTEMIEAAANRFACHFVLLIVWVRFVALKRRKLRSFCRTVPLKIAFILITNAKITGR